ncbi:MAG: hypothetical protein NVS3B26_02100 [Mycobacteriales bacterium]
MIIILLVVVFFGGKKLPDSARSLGQALRIFKAETRGLRDPDLASALPAAQVAATAVPGVAATASIAAPAAPPPAQDGSVPPPSPREAREAAAVHSPAVHPRLKADPGRQTAASEALLCVHTMTGARPRGNARSN